MNLRTVHEPRGHYQENLADGGKLRVFANRWEIEYYFPGPDLRHKGTFVRFADREIENLIDEYRAAYQKWKDLKQSAIKGTELTLPASAHLTVRVGGYLDGVCLAIRHDPVNNDSKLQQKVDSYVLALERAPKIQEMLRHI